MRPTVPGPAACRAHLRRVYAVLLPVLSLPVLSLLLAALFIPPRPAAAQGYPDSYSVTYSGGTVATSSGSSSGSAPYAISYNNPGYGGIGASYFGPGYGASATCSGQITATFTWNSGGNPNYTPPKQVFVVETCQVSAYSNGGPASATTGLPNGSTTNGVTTATRRTVKVNPGNSFTVTCTPNATASAAALPPGSQQTLGVGAQVGYTAAIGTALGSKLANKPGKDPKGNDKTVPCNCSGGPGKGSLQAGIDAQTGNALVTVSDPVPTRGYPLVCNVSLSSQTVETGRPMGNATFSYDVHVTTQTVYDQNGNGVSHWMLVDGDGTRLDFGPSGSAPAPAAGVFSQLTVLTGGAGYKVTGAGGPGAINEAGDFTYLFNGAGQLTQLTDAAGNVQALAYTGGLLTQVTDQGTGKALTFAYSGGLVSQVTGSGGGQSLALAYSGGSLAGVTVKDGTGTTLKTVQYAYDPATGLLSGVTRDGDPGSTISFTYTYMPDANPSDTTGVPMANYSTASAASNISWGTALDPGAASTAVVTFSAGAATAVHYDQDASGNVTQAVVPTFAGATQPLTQAAQYNAQGRATQSSDGLMTELFGYTASGLPNSYTDGLSHVWSWTYSGADLTAAQDPVQAAAGVSATVAYGDPSQPHVPTGATDASGNTWSFAHNAHGQVTTVTPPPGSPTAASSTTYDETTGSPTLGYPLVDTDGNGDRTTYDAYDALGGLLSASTYPVHGNTTTKNTTLFAYDGAQRLTRVTHPDGRTFQTHYTGRNLDYDVDEAGTQYAYSYCPSCGALTGVTGPSVGGTAWSLGWDYNADHDLIAFLDGRGYVTTYTYGNARELTGVTYPDNSTLGYLYTNQGLVRQVTDGRGHQVTLGYDGDERLHTVSFPTTGQPTITVNYDAASRVQSFTDGVGTTTYAYALNGWLTSVQYNYAASGLAGVQELDYTYYPDGSRHTLTWKNGTSTVGTWTYGYDAGGRLTGLTNPWAEASAWAYDGEGKLLSQTDANGTAAAYGYNQARGWPTSLTYSKAGTAFLSFGLAYDGGGNTVGNLTGVSENFNGNLSSVAYGYDALYRLTGEARTGSAPESHAFGYDLAGNRTAADGASFAFDPANKATNAGFSYDGDGDPLSDGVNTYTWDDRGDLLTRAAGGTSLAYGYDARGLRVVSQVGGGAKTFYVFDGGTLQGEVSAAGAVTAAYTWGAAGPVSERLVPSSRSLWYAFGPQGEARVLTDALGNAADTYVYSAYGQPVSASGSDTNPFRYGGQFGYYTEGALAGGVLLCTHRWYDPNAGRWISRDPIGYSGGDNLYAYCGNDPVNEDDPEGLTENVGNTEDDAELERQIKILNQELNAGGLTPQRRAEIRKEINELKGKIVTNEKARKERNKRKRRPNKFVQCPPQGIKIGSPVITPDPMPNPMFSNSLQNLLPGLNLYFPLIAPTIHNPLGGPDAGLGAGAIGAGAVGAGGAEAGGASAGEIISGLSGAAAEAL